MQWLLRFWNIFLRGAVVYGLVMNCTLKSSCVKIIVHIIVYWLRDWYTVGKQKSVLVRKENFHGET